MRKKVYLILLLVSLFALSIGAAYPAMNAGARSSPAQVATCDEAASLLVGRLATLPGVPARVEDLCSFSVNMDQVDDHVSRFDRRFVEHAIASNMLEIQSLEFTLARTENEEWRGLIQMMIAMHTSDLQMALEVAEAIGAETEPDLTDMPVYPGTPEYDLGMRRVDLVARFLDPLMSLPVTDTPTPVPTLGTVVPTETGTLPPTETPTAIDTEMPTFTPTGEATETATETGTLVATETGTAISTVTETSVATETGTPVVTETETGFPTETGTVVPTETGTAVPTITPPVRPDFDLLSLHVIEDEHVMSIEVALAAQRLAENAEIRAFAKHAADVAKLHLLLMNDLKYRLAHSYTLPDPMFEEEYLPPRLAVPEEDVP
jgi:predicted outer membrane protein